MLFNRHAPDNTIYKAVHCARVDGFGRLGRLGSVFCACTRSVILAWSLSARQHAVHCAGSRAVAGKQNRCMYGPCLQSLPLACTACILGSGRKLCASRRWASMSGSPLVSGLLGLACAPAWVGTTPCTACTGGSGGDVPARLMLLRLPSNPVLVSLLTCPDAAASCGVKHLPEPSQVCTSPLGCIGTEAQLLP